MLNLDDYLIGVTSGSESGACLFFKEKLVAAVSEERFSRKKNDSTFPFHSINWLIKEFNLKKKFPFKICFGFTNGLDKRCNIYDLLVKSYNDSILDTNNLSIISNRFQTENYIDSKKFSEFKEKIKNIFPNALLNFYHHHDAHRACSFYSGFENFYALTCDGRGDGLSLTLSKFIKNENFQEIYHAYHFQSLGYFYGRMTHLCGFTANRHEGKVTGLSAKGNPYKAIDLVNKMINFKNGKIFSNLGDYFLPYFSSYSKKLLIEAKKYSKEDLAAAAQFKLEEIVISLIKYYTKKENSFNLCVSGGVFANVRLNQKLKELKKVNNFFVFPNMSDGGISVGACYEYLRLKSHNFKKNIDNKSIFTKKIKCNMYLGPNINVDQLVSTAKKYNKTFLRYSESDLIDCVIDLLLDNKLIALCYGRSEFGPRALGHRSLIALPSDKDIPKKINNSLGRDNFMPLAPVMIDEVASKVIKKFKYEDPTSPFMVSTFDAKKILKKTSPAIVHSDNTCRVQIVKEEHNPFLFKLLKRLYYEKNVHCLINTSFNMHEEPIVGNEISIFNTFMKSKINALISPPYIFSN